MIHHLGTAIDLFLHPGEHAFADENFCIRTTLGSCVAIVLWHPARKLGGMCHFMLPGRRREAGLPLNGKYADEAVELLRAEARKLDTDIRQYEAKIFGGGNMLPGRSDGNFNVAVRNIAAARELVLRQGMRIEAESVGGIGYRNVVFDIARGDVWVRHQASHESRLQLG